MMTFSDLIRALPTMTHDEASTLAIIMPQAMGDDLHRRQDEMGMWHNRVGYVPIGNGMVLVRAAVMRAGLVGERAFAPLWQSVMRWFEEHPEAEGLATVVKMSEVRWPEE